jgi:hypothetical protein
MPQGKKMQKVTRNECNENNERERE